MRLTTQLGILFVGLALAHAGTPAYAQFRIGIEVRDISPSAAELARGELHMGGYGFLGSRGGAQGIHDPVTVRAMVIEVGKSVVALAAVDSAGISNRVLEKIYAQAYAASGIPAENVLISSIHSHSGPDFQGLWGGVSDEYKDFVVAHIASAIAAARFKAEPAELFVSEGAAANVNRRGWGFTDQAVTVIEAKSALTGQRIGAVINFAAHPIVLLDENMLLSSDFVHYVRDSAEKQLGAPVLFINGAVGDVKPLAPSHTYEGAEAYGTSIAAAAVEALSRAVPVTPSISVSTTKFLEPLENGLFYLAYLLGYLDYEMHGVFFPDVDARVSYLKLGNEVEVATTPGEPLTRLGLALKDEMKAPYRMVLGLTGGTMGYLIPRDEWKTSRNWDYEELISVGSMMGERVKAELVQLIRSQQ